MRSTRFAASASRRFVLAGVVPLLVLGVICSVQMFNVGRLGIDMRNQLASETVRTEVEGFIREHVQVALQLRGLTDPDDIQTVMDSATNSITTLESIMLVEPGGAVRIASINPKTNSRAADLIGIDQSRNPECIVAWSTATTAWSGVFTSSVSGDRALSAAVPIDGTLVLITINIEELPGRISQSPVETDAVSMILDSEGTLLFHTDPAVAQQRPNLSTLEPIKRAIARENGSYLFTQDGETMLGSTTSVSGPNWIVLVEQSWDDATRPIVSLLMWVGLAVLVTGTLATVIAVFFARDLSAPISQLRLYTDTVRDGQYCDDVGDYRHQELAELAESIRTMALAVREREDDLDHARTNLEMSNEALLQIVHSTTEAMGKIVGGRDPYTQGHQVRVARLAGDLAREIGCAPYDIEGIELAALVHDIGKLAVPSEILVKPGRLTPIEYQLIQQHPRWGYDILQEIPFQWPIAEIVLQHHERLDGSGYPQGLAGDEVCLGARIIAVADVVEAMASHRPYRASLGIEAALEEVASRPEIFDPEVSAALVALAESGRLILEDPSEA